MLRKGFHLSDQELLLWADGELSSQRATDVRRHLSACWTCRTRMADLEHSIENFIHLYRRELDGNLLPIEGPRAMLRARMAELAASAACKGVWFRRTPWVSAASALAIMLTLAGILSFASHRGMLWSNLSRTGTPPVVHAVPNVTLTPGAINLVSADDVCTANLSVNDPIVPDSLKREVLKEYGLNNVSNTDYEIDYLVTPRLGGATTIRNLWPEPSFNTVWNARVKDALEDRLRSMVCNRQLDLATAQREISANWIAAYKKYFHTDAPLPKHSDWGAI